MILLRNMRYSAGTSRGFDLVDFMWNYPSVSTLSISYGMTLYLELYHGDVQILLVPESHLRDHSVEGSIVIAGLHHFSHQLDETHTLLLKQHTLQGS